MDLDAPVQAGATPEQLNMRHTGLFFPIDLAADATPGDATLGGMAAARTSGTKPCATAPCVRACPRCQTSAILHHSFCDFS